MMGWVAIIAFLIVGIAAVLCLLPRSLGRTHVFLALLLPHLAVSSGALIAALIGPACDLGTEHSCWALGIDWYDALAGLTLKGGFLAAFVTTPLLYSLILLLVCKRIWAQFF